MLNNMDSEKVYDASFDFTGNRAVIYYKEGQSEGLEAKVVSHNKQFHTIMVSSRDIKLLNSYSHVLVIIFADGQLVNYKGTVRKSHDSSSVEIAIYNGTNQESRRHKRFDVNISAFVDRLVISDQSVTLRKPFDILFLNMSSSGALIRTYPGVFFLGTVFRTTVDINGSDMVVLCIVVRVSEKDIETCDYGCEFLEIEQ